MRSTKADAHTHTFLQCVSLAPSRLAGEMCSCSTALPAPRLFVDGGNTALPVGEAGTSMKTSERGRGPRMPLLLCQDSCLPSNETHSAHKGTFCGQTRQIDRQLCEPMRLGVLVAPCGGSAIRLQSHRKEGKNDTHIPGEYEGQMTERDIFQRAGGNGSPTVQPIF